MKPKTKPKTENQGNDNIYDSDNVEKLLEDDEIDSTEAGFMEGYNQKQSVQGKKPKRIVQDR